MISKQKKERVRMICGQGFDRLDIPAWWRRKEIEERIQADVVSDGRQDEKDRREITN